MLDGFLNAKICGRFALKRNIYSTSTKSFLHAKKAHAFHLDSFLLLLNGFQKFNHYVSSYKKVVDSIVPIFNNLSRLLFH